MHISLSGRTAIVTGGSKGLGFATAKQLVASGAQVVINGRGAEALEAAERELRAVGPGRVVAVRGDVSLAADVQRLYDEAMKAFGKVDILVNNAGTARAVPFEQLTDEMLQADLELKLFAAVRAIRLVLPQMKARRWGRILNVLNIGAKAPTAASSPSTLSRAAGLALTKSLSLECAPHNVLVNALLIGFIEAEQHAQAAQRAGVELADYVKGRAASIPLRRIGRAEELAGLACFLASDAGSYITGTGINVDGGSSPLV